MAAKPTLSNRLQFRKSTESPDSRQQSLTEPPTLRASRHGVVTLFGYGIKISVERGHLMLEDGIGADRHRWRFSRVGHGLKRLVVIGNDGFISLAALRWLADQDAAFVMLERDGSVLASTGPAPGLDDARLRRAQAFACHSDLGLQIARELIDKKLTGQERVARDKLLNSEAANTIARFRANVNTAQAMATIRLMESQAAAEYWSAWQNVSITFPRSDIPRMPDHWRVFGRRTSPLSGSPRSAINPANSILNFLYSLLEAESRLAANAIGLDPGFGFVHLDKRSRASFACDLMESVRPEVDAFVFDWITGSLLKCEWFFEQRDGTCRLMAPFAAQLSETMPMWRRAVAPFAEWVAHTLWSSIKTSDRRPATPLTQRHRREANNSTSLLPPPLRPPTPQHLCPGCGARIASDSKNCPSCNIPTVIANLVAGAVGGRVKNKSAKSRARLRNTQRRHHAERRNWKPSMLPGWLNQDVYDRKIQPLLMRLSRGTIMATLGVSKMYAGDIRSGKRRPHPRHWEALAQLVGVSGTG